MITQTRHMLAAAIESLEDELATARAELADRDRIRADRDRLREVVRMVVDRGRAVPMAEEFGTAGVSAVFERREWDAIAGAAGGWPEGGEGG